MKPQDIHPPIRQGLVLASSPELTDPNFREALIFMAEHDPQGSLGFILNRPLGHSLRELVQAGAEIDEALYDVPVFFGGPVRRENLFLVLFERGSNDEELSCRVNIPIEELTPYQGAAHSWIRAFLGYSGWGEGQLETELAADAWIVRKPHVALLDDHISPSLWSVFTGADQRWRRLLPHLPRDPTTN